MEHRSQPAMRMVPSGVSAAVEWYMRGTMDLADERQRVPGGACAEGGGGRELHGGNRVYEAAWYGRPTGKHATIHQGAALLAQPWITHVGVVDLSPEHRHVGAAGASVVSVASASLCIKREVVVMVNW